MESMAEDKRRQCYCCGTFSTRVRKGRNGHQSWFCNVDMKTDQVIHYLCKSCYGRLTYKPRSLMQLSKYVENQRGRRIRYPGLHITLSWNPRKYLCSECPATGETDMHHALGYFRIFPWFGLVELCSPCHYKRHSNHIIA